MGTTLNCPVKINLTLHILDRRADGYHELRSVFWKKTANERLTVERAATASLDVDGAKIDGKNLLSSVLEFASDKIDIPPLSLKLCKKYPQGSGIGAGSGNAAALLCWLNENCGLTFSSEEAAKLGADVAVLAQKNALHYAEGVGEKLTVMPEIEGLHWLLVFPKWSSNTAAAYAKLDAIRNQKEKIPYDYLNEAASLIQKLAAHKQTGLLPNDFLKVAMTEHKEYAQAFNIAEQTGALVWGMCGSGSSMFFVSENMNIIEEIDSILCKESWTALSEKLE